MKNTEIQWLGGTIASRRAGTGNLVSSWKAWAIVNYGSLAKAYKAIESELGGAADPGNISRWERGVRRMPPSAVNYMLNEILPDLLAESADPLFILERIQLPANQMTSSHVRN